MGADIHSFAEIKNNQGWKLLGNEFDNPWYDPKAKDDYSKNSKHMHPVESRNYDAFAILANVRNGYGFAGVDTGDAFKIMSEPKGLPQDMSLRLQAISEGEDEDLYIGDHSFSWLTLKELVEFDWHLDTIQSGVVSVKEFMDASTNSGVPTSWRGAIWGPKITNIAYDEMTRRIAEDDFEMGQDNYYTKLEWPESYKEASGELWSATIPRLKEIAERRNLTNEQVRIVFGFDS